MKLSSIFISYSRDNKEYAYKLEKFIRESGFNVWIDKQDINIQDKWIHKIENAIEECAAFLIIMTPRSKTSDWVQRELQYAEECKKPIFPLLLEGKTWFQLGNIQFIDVTDGNLPDSTFLEKLSQYAYRDRLPIQNSQTNQAVLSENDQLIIQSHKDIIKTTDSIIGDMPIPTLNFVNRSRDLENISKYLYEGCVVNLYGRDGVGKSALACKFLDNLQKGKWIHSNEDFILKGMVYFNLAVSKSNFIDTLFHYITNILNNDIDLRAIQLEKWKTTKEKLRILLKSLNKIQPVTILLFDHVEIFQDQSGKLYGELQELLEEWIHLSGNIRLILVSQRFITWGNPHIQSRGKRIEVENMDLDAQINLLLQYDRDDKYDFRKYDYKTLEKLVQKYNTPRAIEVLIGRMEENSFMTVDHALENDFSNLAQTLKGLEPKTLAIIKIIASLTQAQTYVSIKLLEYTVKTIIPNILDNEIHRIATDLNKQNLVRILERKYISLSQETDRHHILILKDHEYSISPTHINALAASFYRNIRPQLPWNNIDDLKFQLSEIDHLIWAEKYDQAAELVKILDYKYLSRWGYAEKVLSIRRKLETKIKDQNLVCDNLGSIGDAYWRISQYEEAIKYHQSALELAQRISDKKQECWWAGSLGLTYFSQGSLDKAQQYCKHALELSNHLNDIDDQSRNLGNLGRIAYADKDSKSAIEYLTEAIHKADQLLNHPNASQDNLDHAKRIKSRHITMLGQIYAAQDSQKAIEYYEIALRLVSELAYKREEVDVRNQLGKAYLELGQYKFAIAEFHIALAISGDNSDGIHYGRGSYEALENMASAYKKLGDYNKAEEYTSQASKWAVQLGIAAHS